MKKSLISLLFIFFLLPSSISWGADAPQQKEYPFSGDITAEEGYWVIVNFPLVRPSFNTELFDNLWKVWEEPLRSQAAKASPAQRRSMAFRRYGLTNRPGKTKGMPLQYTQYGKTGWSLNCFACHSGKVDGQIMPNAPNSLFAMQTISEDVQKLKVQRNQLNLSDIAVGLFPKGSSNGTTNAVTFGVAVNAFRDQHLNFVPTSHFPKFIHHDMDTPAWWNTKYKKWLYLDGGIQTNHRALVPFSLGDRHNTGKQVRSWDRQFQAIYKYLQSLAPPKYPNKINQQLADAGRIAFNANCASCHGQYGKNSCYPERTVLIENLKTDRARHDALSKERFIGYEKSWLSFYGKTKCRPETGGYVAPPLHGIWASAPYLHNGSVPTLWHLLHPNKRPQLWKRSLDGYDHQKVGLEFVEAKRLPADVKLPAQKRTWFDSRLFSKSNKGHLYPNKLTEKEKKAVLEYLKQL